MNKGDLYNILMKTSIWFYDMKKICLNCRIMSRRAIEREELERGGMSMEAACDNGG